MNVGVALEKDGKDLRNRVIDALVLLSFSLRFQLHKQ